MNDVTHSALSLIGRLADAAGAGHTLTAIARRLATVLADTTALRRLELGRLDDATHADVVVCEIDRGETGPDLHVRETTADLRDTLILEAIHANRRITVVNRADSGSSAPPAHSDVRGAFADESDDAPDASSDVTERYVVLTLTDDGRERPFGFATIQIGASDVFGNHFLADPLVLEAVARVLAMSLRNARLIERVATLSRRAHRENAQLRQQLQVLEAPKRLVARSEGMRQVLARVELVAQHPTTVLLRGESGTGKELVARRIHRISSRGNRPFQKVNCGAIPLELVESELFGHERGAFTGASRKHAGLFERADTGTILLDEIGELPLAAQVKLLRVLQEGQFERVGGEVTQSVDVRVIAATHRDLESMVSDGAFREDLYYRLNVFPIEIPPLRERIEDLERLVEVLLEDIARRHGRESIPRPTPELLDRLRSARWPGNVRELENVLERALILSPGEMLRLPDDLLDTRSAGLPPSSERQRDRSVPNAQPMTFREATTAAIEDALRRSAGRIYGDGGAAAMLELHPSTLQSKMKKLGIERTAFVPDR